MKSGTIPSRLLGMTILAAVAVISVIRLTGGVNPPVSDQGSDEMVNVKLLPRKDIDVVYIFVTSTRTGFSIIVETYTRDTITETFPRRLASGEVVIATVNTDEGLYHHFIDDFELTEKSVVLCKIRGGEITEWKKCDRMWHFIKDEPGFKDYISTEAVAFFGEEG